jgi:hypothetical protein
MIGVVNEQQAAIGELPINTATNGAFDRIDQREAQARELADKL